MCEGFPRQGIENASDQTGRWLRNLVTYNEIKIYLNPQIKIYRKSFGGWFSQNGGRMWKEYNDSIFFTGN
jgi:hypothetical protein